MYTLKINLAKVPFYLHCTAEGVKTKINAYNSDY